MLKVSLISTPQTLRQYNRAAEQLEFVISQRALAFANELQRSIRGSLITGTELVQVKSDLQRTKIAEAVAQAHRKQKDRPLRLGEC